MRYFNTLALFALFALLDLTLGQSCAAPGQVGGLTLREDENTGNLVATWTAPAGTTGCTYRVHYTNNAPVPADLTFTTSALTQTISGEFLVPCSLATVTVTAVGTSEGQATSASLTLATRPTTAPILYNMTTSCDSIRMIWEGQPYAENMCQVTHFQLFCLSDSHNFTIPQGVTDEENRNFDITISAVLRADTFYSCNGFLFVTLAGFSPGSDTIQFWSNLDSVRDLEVSNEVAGLRATWYPPLNSEQCGVGYYVQYENEVLGTETFETENLYYDFDIEVIPCTEYAISVTPISFTGSSGTKVTKTYEPLVTVGSVSNLNVVDNVDRLTVSWQAVNVGKCDVFFRVTHYVDDELVEVLETTSNSIDTIRVPCSYHRFVVAVVSDGSEGEGVVFEIVLSSEDVDEITAVTNIQASGNTLSWTPPDSIGRCSLAYRVEHDDGFNTVTRTVVSTQIDLTLIPCATNNVRIWGVAGTLTGAVATHSWSSAAADFDSPENLRTIPDFTSADLVMGAEALSVNSCPITSASVSCSNDAGDSFERTIAVSDNSERTFELELTDLEQDTIYTCFVGWGSSPKGSEIRFRTIAIPTKQLWVTGVTEDGFTVNWSEDYGTEFVRSYQLVINSNGPAHAVRDDCDIETGNTFTFNLSPGELSQAFAGGFPHFDYDVTLTTTYNLGSLGVTDISEVLDTRTLTSAPGEPDDMGIEFEYEGGTVYNVTGIVSWRAPCDLNGELRSFGVLVTATFQLGGVDQTVEYETTVAASNVNDRHSFALREINPFFRYVVSVHTVAASAGPNRDIVITPPDVCSCA